MNIVLSLITSTKTGTRSVRNGTNTARGKQSKRRKNGIFHSGTWPRKHMLFKMGIAVSALSTLLLFIELKIDLPSSLLTLAVDCGFAAFVGRIAVRMDG
ncbi:unnamed protein product [Onchocerca flexuosa]|uniref:Iron ABC transporter n=1 Tax=Onchocerca flexuosa TaxID=387005 RepID=A0A183I4A6_9BILA|nr:unnamed protein product [Onchocerca flexuosa]